MTTGPPSDGFVSEQDGLRERVYLVDGDIVIWEEPRGRTTRRLDALFDRLFEVTQGMPSFKMLVDELEAERPDAEYRAHIKRRMRELRGRVSHVAVVVGDNFMLRVAAKFVARGLSTGLISVHKTRNEALEVLRSGER